MEDSNNGSSGSGPTRRQAIALIGLSAVTSIAGCSSSSDNSDSTSSNSTTSNSTGTTAEETTTEDVEKSTKDEIVALADALVEFRNSLSDDQLSSASFEVGNDEEFSWSNFPSNTDSRGGIMFGDMSDKQVGLFYDAMDAWLSDDGINKVKTITQDVEAILHERNSEEWGNDYYHAAMFGNPDEDAVWGYQIDGHHMAINFVVYGDEATIVPAFVGSEPAELSGEEVLGDERNLAFQLLHNLDDDQQSQAIRDADRGIQAAPAGAIGGGGTNGSAPNGSASNGNFSGNFSGNGSAPDGNFSGNGSAPNGSAPNGSNGSGQSGGMGGGVEASVNFDYSQFDGVGLSAADMNDNQKQMLRNLIKVYVYKMDHDLASDWISDINDSFDDTYFVWIGDTTTDSPIYYRVYNPAVWIEYNNEAGNATSGDLNHIHTVTRAPNGGDYGQLSYDSSTANNSSLTTTKNTLLDHYYETDHHSQDVLALDYTYDV